MSLKNRVRFTIGYLCLSAAEYAAAQGICLPIAPDTAVESAVAAGPGDSGLVIDMGNFVVGADAGVELFDGVRFRYLDGELRAERASIDRDDSSIDVIGTVTFENEEFSVFAENAALDRDAEQISFSAAGFDVPARPARGRAEQIVIVSDARMSLTSLFFTTCPEDDMDWELIARELELDAEAGLGTARGVKLKFKGVPILYSPYFSFPIDDQRKSGFLTPDIAERERTGFDVTLPYYLNLAPNYDLTLSPRYMSARGVKIDSDFRYLMPRSEGAFLVEYLADDSETGDDRRYVDLQHETLFGAGWQLVAGVEEVSDDAYFEDMGETLSVTSQTHLNRFLDLGFFAPRWSVHSRFQNYQTIDTLIDPADRPYERVPQILFEGQWGLRLLGFDSTTELVNFDREVGTTGWRLDSTQELSLKLARAGMHLTPAIALRQTNYWLDDPGTGEEYTLRRGVPISSIDTGLAFERPAGESNRWIQTLEPRLLLVKIPFEDQSELPVFDTIMPDFNLVQLFRKYQFVGPDRIADTDQLSYGVTTRLIDGGSGRERLNATLGRTRYLSTQDVALPDGLPNNADASDYVAELGINLGDAWSLDVGYQWNSDTDTTARAETRFEYRPQADRLFGLAYRLREGLLEQGDLSMVWPVGDRWRLIGQYSYSLLEEEPLEQFVGLEYEACCWRARVTGRRYISRSTGEIDSTISFQLELKGLTQRAPSAEELLDRGILGYRRFTSAAPQ